MFFQLLIPSGSIPKINSHISPVLANFQIRMRLDNFSLLSYQYNRGHQKDCNRGLSRPSQQMCVTAKKHDSNQCLPRTGLQKHNCILLPCFLQCLNLVASSKMTWGRRIFLGLTELHNRFH
uniref:Uncharacterized protein n=1 Tax=Opuntia streptacantha TaxID=393608 RepID=A0A7C8ZU48_OPUST